MFLLDGMIRWVIQGRQTPKVRIKYQTMLEIQGRKDPLIALDQSLLKLWRRCRCEHERGRLAWYPHVDTLRQRVDCDAGFNAECVLQQPNDIESIEMQRDLLQSEYLSIHRRMNQLARVWYRYGRILDFQLEEMRSARL